MADYTIMITAKSPISCHALDLVCFLDHHSAFAGMLGPLITTLLTIIVASTGWWYSSYSSDRASRRLQTFLRRAGDRGLEGARLIMEKINRQQNIVQADLERVDAELADLTLMVEGLPVLNWPSPSIFVTARALRDRILVLADWMQLDGKQRDEFWPTAEARAQSLRDAHLAFLDQIARLK